MRGTFQSGLYGKRNRGTHEQRGVVRETDHKEQRDKHPAEGKKERIMRATEDKQEKPKGSGLSIARHKRDVWNDDEIAFLLRKNALGHTYAELAKICSDQFGREIGLADAAYRARKYGTPSRKRPKQAITLAGGIK
jgi:hypothetical protein